MGDAIEEIIGGGAAVGVLETFGGLTGFGGGVAISEAVGLGTNRFVGADEEDKEGGDAAAAESLLFFDITTAAGGLIDKASS